MTKKCPSRSTRIGNTKQCAKRITASKLWCFTLNNYTNEEVNTLKEKLMSDLYVFGYEVGESGTPHIQGFVKFSKATRPLEKLSSLPRIHWEKCKGTEKQNITYCTKDGKYDTNYKELPIPKPLKLITKLRPFQKSIENIIKKEPDDRSIIWIYEPFGNVGKTQMCKYFSHHYGAIPLEGKKNDILYCAAMFESNVYIYDLERSMEDYVSYASIEKIKNGYFMCSKYESKPIVRNSPHVIIVANFEPDESQLSSDRWCIYTINDNYELVRKK